MSATPNKPDKPAAEGAWLDPFLKQTLIPPDLQEALRQQVQSRSGADEEQDRLLAQGWRWQADVARDSGVALAVLATRTKKIDPAGDYLSNGCLPSADSQEPTVKGATLRWRHPQNRNITLLAPSYAAGIIDAERREAALREQDYQPQFQIADAIGMPRVRMSTRTRRIIPDGDYLPNGHQPTAKDGEITVKGDTLRWQHPYNDGIVLIAPLLAQGLIEAEAQQKDLQAKGYVQQFEVSDKGGISVSTVSNRTRRILPDEDYLADGTRPTGKADELTIKGAMLRWVHPYDSGNILLAPEFAKRLIESEQAYTKLQQAGYRLQADVAEAAGLKRQTLATRTGRIIDDNADYLPDGRQPRGLPGEQTVKGNTLRWQHPYDYRTILLSPEFSQGIINAEEQAAALSKQGYKQQSDVTNEHDIRSSAFTSRTRLIEPDKDYLLNGQLPTGAAGEEPVKGSVLRWQHPYDYHQVLLHPEYAAAAIASHRAAARGPRVKRGATAEKVGDVAVPPAELMQELAEQDRDDQQRRAK